MRCAVFFFGGVLTAFAVSGCGGGGGAAPAIPAAPAALTGSPAPDTAANPAAPLLSGAAYLIPAGANVLRGALAGSTTAATLVTASAVDLNGSGDASAMLTLSFGAAPSSAIVRPASIVARTVQTAALSGGQTHQEDLSPKVYAALRNSLRPAPVTARRPSTARVAQSLAVGAQQQFGVAQFDGTVTDTPTYTQVPATLLALTPHGQIWAMTSLLTSGALSAADAAQLSTDFENGYASDVLHFGTPHYTVSAPQAAMSSLGCDAAGNQQAQTYSGAVADPGTIAALIIDTDVVGKSTGGYFQGINFMPQPLLNCYNAQHATAYQSNEMPVIYLGWFREKGHAYEITEDMARDSAHELQHLINFVNHSIDAQNPAEEEVWINEGLSVLAQDFAIHALYPATSFDVDEALGVASFYLAAPQNFSITGFTGADPGGATRPGCTGCYGGAYLLQRYLYDRFGGDRYTQAMETSAVTGLPNIAAASGSNESGAALFADFAMALAAANAPGTTSDTRFVFGTLNPAGSYVDEFGQTTVLHGAQLAGAAGGGSQLSATVGGFALYSLSGLRSAGETMTLTDTTGTAQLAAGVISR